MNSIIFAHNCSTLNPSRTSFGCNCRNRTMQPSESMTAFSICRHGAAINKNHEGKILPTLFFTLKKTIKSKEKTES